MKFVRRDSRSWFLICTSLVALVFSLSACKSKPKPTNIGVLGSRDLVPPPYARPVAFSAENSGLGSARPLVGTPAAPALAAGQGDREPLPPSTDTFVPAETPVYVPAEHAPAPENVLSTPPVEKPVAPVIAAPMAAQPSPAAPVAAAGGRTYQVQKGDTLSGIAQCVGVKWQDIAALNPKVNPNRMLVGEKLVLPAHALDKPIVMPKSSKPAHKNTASGNAVKSSSIPSDGIYTVASGDSLWTISRRFKVSSDDIRAWNDLKTDKLTIGQKLKLKGTAVVKETATKSAAKPDSAAGAAPAAGDTVKASETPVNPGETTDAAAAAVPAAGDAEKIVTPADAVPAETASTRSLDHLVSENDTLESIAAIYEVKLEDILRSNPQIKSNADLIKNTTIKITYPIKK